MEAVNLAAQLAAGPGWGPGPWWPIFPLFWLFLWGGVIFAIFRFRRRPWSQGHSPEDVLADRYARGEISVEEYRDRLRVLKEHR